MSQYGIYFNQTRCIGCRTCMVACKNHNNINPGKTAYRKFAEFEEGNDYPNLTASYILYGCNHCEAPKCMASCPVSAIEKRLSDGIVLTNRNRCDGCGEYITACPWNMPQISSDIQEPESNPGWATRHPA